MKRVKESNTKFAKTLSLLTTRSVEMEPMKKCHAEEEQKFYDIGFSNAKDLITIMMKEARLKSFTDGWVAALNALQVPLTSPYHAVENVPYTAKLTRYRGVPKPTIQVPTEGVPAT